MRHVQWDISAAAVLLFALVYFFDGSGIVSALVPAALAHELGHVLALRACSCRVTRVRLGLTGAELDYAPRLEGLRCAFCLLSGPLAGLLYALGACTAGGAFLRMSGAVSFLLSAFNLMPVLPLDGGRLVGLLLPEKQARRLSLAASLLLLGGGVAIAARFSSAALLLAGLWLAGANLRSLPGACVRKWSLLPKAFIRSIFANPSAKCAKPGNSQPKTEQPHF